MPPKETSKGKKEKAANFKTYEAQARLLAALVASLDNTKFDYKKIALGFGGGTSESAMEHKFRVVRWHGHLTRVLLGAGLDPAAFDLPRLGQAEIHRLFGASTPDGLSFQFRAVKKSAAALQAAVKKGADPIEAFATATKGELSAASGDSTVATGSTPTSVPATPSSNKRARSTTASVSGSGTTPATKRHRARKIEADLESGSFDDDEDSAEVDYLDLDKTPTKLKPKVLSTARKNPPLLPRSAWAKPTPETTAPRHVPIAPAPPRPSGRFHAAAPSYTLSSIPGIGSSELPPGYVDPSLPNGYTDPATGFGYNVAPIPPPRNHTAVDIATGRPVSSHSSGSYTAANSPVETTLYQDPNTAPANSGYPLSSTIMGMMGADMANQYPPHTSIAMSPDFPNMAMSPEFHNAAGSFNPSASPSVSSPGVYTPQTNNSSSLPMSTTTFGINTGMGISMGMGMGMQGSAGSFAASDDFTESFTVFDANPMASAGPTHPHLNINPDTSSGGNDSNNNNNIAAANTPENTTTAHTSMAKNNNMKKQKKKNGQNSSAAKTTGSYVPFDEHEAELAANLDFGGFEGEEPDGEWDAGEI